MSTLSPTHRDDINTWGIPSFKFDDTDSNLVHRLGQLSAACPTLYDDISPEAFQGLKSLTLNIPSFKFDDLQRGGSGDQSSTSDPMLCGNVSPETFQGVESVGRNTGWQSQFSIALASVLLSASSIARSPETSRPAALAVTIEHPSDCTQLAEDSLLGSEEVDDEDCVKFNWSKRRWQLRQRVKQFSEATNADY